MVGAALSLRGRRAAGALLAREHSRRHRRRGPERAADPAASGAPPAHDRQPDRAGWRPGWGRHACRARPPRRSADGDAVRPDAAATSLRARAAGDRTIQDVDCRSGGSASPDRLPRCSPRSAAVAPARARRACCSAPFGTALVADVWRSQTVPGRQRQPLRRRRAGRACRAAARAAAARPARAAGLLRGRGDPPGRRARLRRASPSRARRQGTRGS